MIQRFVRILAVPLSLAFASSANAQEASPSKNLPPDVPATRLELKEFLETSKQNTPRLPLPPLSDADREKMEKGNWGSADWSIYNNGRTRKHYLPIELADVSSLRGDDPAMSLGYQFQTKLFWIVSRANNCTYCMGHQESKLAATGLGDDQIAELDGDWEGLPDKDRAAFEFTRKLTYEPHRLTDADLDSLRRFYSDAQILEIVNAVANFNAMNRWTGALRIPQENHRVYLTATSEKFRDLVSRQAPLDLQGRASGRKCAKPAQRPPLESRAEVEDALARCKNRQPRLPLIPEAQARSVIASESSERILNWERLLATFTKSGVGRITVHHAAAAKGELDPLLRAQIAWICARNDRAWYALGHAREWLRGLGQTDEAIFSLDQGNFDQFSRKQQAVFSLARKLTVDPALIQDSDVEAIRNNFSDKETAEIVFQVTENAYFDRLTEAVGLPLEQ